MKGFGRAERHAEAGAGRPAGSRAAVQALALALLVGIAACGGSSDEAQGGGEQAIGSAAGASAQPELIRLWAAGTPAFGVFVPSERPMRGPDGERQPALYTAEGGQRLAEDPLLDYLFLNLEGSYDADAVRQIAQGLASPTAVSDKTLLVRIPPISVDGADAARARVAESLAAGADGIVIPHVESVEQAREAVSFFTDIGADVWSPQNPDGTVIAMLMIEDPGALAQVQEIADTPGYSVLACGIGSLTMALGRDREAGERGNQEVLAHAKRVGLPDMITANADDVAQRIDEGFLGLLMNGPDADAHIQVGREHAGR